MSRWRAIYALAATAIAAVIAVLALARLPWPTVLAAVAATFVAGYGLSWQADRRKRGTDPALRAQQQMIRHLWETTRCLPARSLLTDPVTGRQRGAERGGRFLTLLVAGPPDGPDDPGMNRIVHRYMLGFARRPLRPPLMHDLTSSAGQAGRLSRRQARQALQLAEQTGVANTDPAELAALVIQLDRAVAAGRMT